MLKKEFKKKDVQRARNLIQGKTGASSETQIGYKKKQVEYKEGDVWTEGRKTWTIKKGIKQTISKLDKARKSILTPLCCPKCDKIMKHHLDISSYSVHKNCYDCLIEFEHKLQNQGKYDKYIKNLKASNNLTILDEVESYLLDVVNQSNNGYVSEDGVIERWVGGVDKEKYTKEIKKAAKSKRKRLNKELND
jgi:hypothetical protein